MTNIVSDLIKQLKCTKVLVKSSNFIQYIDSNGEFKSAQYDYINRQWYNFKESGSSLNPVETFENWITIK